MVKVRLVNGQQIWVTPNIAHGLIERGEAKLVKPKEAKKKTTKEMKPGRSKSYKTK